MSVPATSLFDPGASVLAHAAQWIEGTLLGSVTTAICVIAIALLGLAMLAGRIPVREGIRVLLGCFLLLGAPAIAAGLLREGSAATPVETVPATTSALVTATPAPYDPYAGASVPRQ